MKFLSVINQNSGSVPEQADRLLKDAVEKHGHKLEVHHIDGSQLDSVCGQIRNKSADGLIAWGGDGTLTCMLNCAAEMDLPVLPLPGGTMNMLCQRVHGEKQDWEKTLDMALSAHRQVPLPAAGVAQDKFYVGLLLGHLTQLARSREHIRSGEVIPAVRAVLTDDALDLTTALSLRTDKEDWQATAAGIFVPQEEDKLLHIVTIDPDNLVDLFDTSIGALTGKWDEAPGVSRQDAYTVKVKSEAPELSATLDGEHRMLVSDIEVTLIPEAVQVWSGAPA